MKLTSKVNPDLIKERNSCTFRIEELAEWWHGGVTNLKEKRTVEKLFLEDPDLHDETPSSYLSWRDLHSNSLRKMQLIVRKIDKYEKDYEHKHGKMDFIKKLRLRGQISNQIMGTSIQKEENPLAVHMSMFIYTLEIFCNDEQKALWLEKAWNFEILGTYAQTELGHGTYIRGLETTATYDSNTQEFVLHTPNLSSYKWWPGSMGTNTNYAIVVANLYINDQCFGPHPFMLQTRNSDTWQPMPGIEIGEIGPKMGCNNYNNGYLGLNNVRIPRMNMLMRNAQVLEDGTYIQPPAQVLNYFTMLFIRTTILFLSASSLAKASAIAIRYSAVRRQSPIEPDKPEPQIIDHITQQYKLLPNLATAFVFHLTFNHFFNLFETIRKELEQFNLTRLSELHALLSCLKPACTYAASTGVEILRLSCGGHGYMDSSGLPSIYTTVVAACTYEGDNTVLLLQTARYLMKSWKVHLENGELEPTIAYIARCKNAEKWNPSLPGIIQAFENIAAEKIRIAYETVQKHKATGKSHPVANNLAGLELVQAAEAHARVILFETAFITTKDLRAKVSEQLTEVVQQLAELYIVDNCLKNLGDLLRFTNITESDIQTLQSRMENLLSKLRPNAVAIVDGFDFHDLNLNSTLGAYDGNAYERLFNEAQKSPLNRDGVSDAFEKYLKPLIKPKL